MSQETEKPTDDDIFLPADEEESSNEVAALEAELAVARQEAEQVKLLAQRKAADLENQRKRHMKERTDDQQYATEGVIKDMVGVLDDLHRAVEHLPADATGIAEVDNMVQGVRLVHRKFVTTMERRGVTSESAVGTLFDPQMHEALQQLVDDSVPEGTVIREFQRAYKLHDRLLRPAMVVVATGGPSPTAAPAIEVDEAPAIEVDEAPAIEVDEAPTIEVEEVPATLGEVIEVSEVSADEVKG